MSDGRLERALRALDAADRACPADARRSRLPRAQILATLGRLGALAPVLDAIIADPASTVDERHVAAQLRDQLALARSAPPPSDEARRTARELRAHAASLLARDRDNGITLLAGSGKPIPLGANTGPALAVSRDGRWLAAGTGEGLAIWDVAHEVRAGAVQDAGSRFAYAQFSPDARLVFVIGTSAAAFDVATGAKRYAFAPYTGSIFAYAPRSPGLAFGPAATVFASPTERGELVLVRTADGRELGKVYAWHDGTGAVIAPDGRFALLGGATDLPDAMCRAGAFTLPLAACRDRFETPDLLAILLAGDPR